MTTFSIFMPAYNAASFLADTIHRIPAGIWPHIKNLYIINDGSTDATGAIADGLIQKYAPVKPVHFSKNRGYGAAVQEGLSLCKADGCDMAVCLHADGQYAPELLGEFITACESGRDIVQGSRIASKTALSGGMPLYKFIGNRGLTFFENLVFGLRMTDYHSGYLAYSRKALDAIPFEKLSGSFDFDLEVIATARACKMSIGEIPIPTRYAGEVSHVNSIAYGLRCLRVMGRYLSGYYNKFDSKDSHVYCKPLPPLRAERGAGGVRS